MSPEDPCKRWLMAPEFVRCHEFEQDATSATPTRPVTRISPAASRRWRQWIDITGLFSGLGDPLAERAELAYDVRDPWNP